MATKRKSAGKRKRASKQQNSLVANINRRKKAGKSRPKSRSTISREAYSDMQQGWPRNKRTGKKSTRRKKSS